MTGGIQSNSHVMFEAAEVVGNRIGLVFLDEAYVKEQYKNPRQSTHFLSLLFWQGKTNEQCIFPDVAPYQLTQ